MMVRVQILLARQISSAACRSSDHLEQNCALMLRHLGDLVGATARINKDLDRLRARVEGIERQLELLE
ncbi:hypothetical protein AX768_02275 [Burkholderia sp. PAMC 28687]|nr:hypothetical protein AX768_02275 [Burkholderia sp. PAMC 28687]